MKIRGFDDDQIAAICEKWKLGKPIDVSGFLDRRDIPQEAKQRIQNVGAPSSFQFGKQKQAQAYRRMVSQIIREVAKLDREHWVPS